MQLLKFGIVGGVGFVIDAGVTFGLTRLGLTPWLARVPAYLLANVATYALNRSWTFRHEIGFWRGWGRYFASTAAGAAVNYAAFSVVMVLAHHTPAALFGAVAAGSIAGMIVNYLAARHLVFR